MALHGHLKFVLGSTVSRRGECVGADVSGNGI